MSDKQGMDEAERNRFLMAGAQGSDMRPNALDVLDVPRLEFSRHGRDCFSAAAASAYGLPLAEMPDTSDDDPAWFETYQRHFLSRGLLAFVVAAPPFYVSCLEIPGRENGHAIVGRDGRRVFDPVRNIDPERVRARASWAEQGRVYAVKTPRTVEDVVRIAYALANRLETFDKATAVRALASLDHLTGKK